jgi:hypothetical protein
VDGDSGAPLLFFLGFLPGRCHCLRRGDRARRARLRQRTHLALQRAYVPQRRIGGALRGAMLLGAVSRDELCQIVLHQGLNEPAGKLEWRAPIE